MAEIDLSDSKQFEAWLKKQSREVCVAIAARAALRVFPTIATEFSGKLDHVRVSSAIILPIIRAMALPLAAATYPARGNELRAAAAAGSETGLGGTGAVTTVAFAAIEALDAFFGVFHSDADANASAAAHAAAAVRAAAGASAIARAQFIKGPRSEMDIWKAVTQDMPTMIGGHSAEILAGKPLWSTRRPPEWVRHLWPELKSTLHEANEGWDVWTRWYDAVLDGRPSPGGEELDIYHVTLDSKEDWKKGPAHVNALIRAKEQQIAGEAMSVGEMWAATQPQVGATVVDYFLSYSTKDEKFARWMGALIEQHGKSVFAQFKDIRPGNNFVREMQRGLARSKQLIALLSPDFEKSDHCQAEWAAAYREDPSGGAQKIVPFLIRPARLNELSQQVVYESLIGLSEADAKSAVLKALGLRGSNESLTVRWPGTEAMEPLVKATAGIYAVEPGNDLRLKLKPPQVSEEPSFGLTPAQMYASALDTIRRFVGDARSPDGNRSCSWRLHKRIDDLDRAATVSPETCNSLALNDCLGWVLRVILLDQLDGVIPPNDVFVFHASDLLGLYNRLERIFPDLKGYRALKFNERFTPPDADTLEVIEAIRKIFGSEALQSGVFVSVLARDLELSVANAGEVSADAASRKDESSRKQELESHKGAAARVMPVWDWLANARQKFVQSGRNAAEVSEAIENYEKLYGKLAPSMMKFIEYFMKWLI